MTQTCMSGGAWQAEAPSAAFPIPQQQAEGAYLATHVLRAPILVAHIYSQFFGPWLKMGMRACCPLFFPGRLSLTLVWGPLLRYDERPEVR